MPIFTIPHSSGDINSFPINISNILYFSRGSRIISKNISGTVTKTNYFTIEFAFLNNKEIYWYFEKEIDREEEFSRLLSL